MKTFIKTILMSIGLSTILNAQNTGLPQWPLVNSQDSILQILDWKTPNPTIDAVPLSGFYDVGAVGAAYDACGNLVFTAIHNGSSVEGQLRLYDTNGDLLNTPSLPSDNSFNAVRGRQEIQVIPVPKVFNEWYIIYRHFSRDLSAPLNDASYRPARVLYSRVRWANNELIVVEQDKYLIADAFGQFYNDGMAVSKYTFNNDESHYLYLCRRNFTNNDLFIDRFILNEAGISWDMGSGALEVGYSDITNVGSPIELSDDGTRLAVVNRNAFSDHIDLVILDTRTFDISTAIPIRSDELVLVADGQPGDYSNVLATGDTIKNIALDASLNMNWLGNFDHKLSQIEFSPDGRFLYIVDGGFQSESFSNLTYLAQIDLEASPLEVRLQIQTTPNDDYTYQTGVGCLLQNCEKEWNRITDIQKAPNGKLYFTKKNDPTLYVIPNPDEEMPQNLVPSNIDLSTSFDPNIQLIASADLLMDQIDDFDYLASRNPLPDSIMVSLDVEYKGCNQHPSLYVNHNIDERFTAIAFEWIYNNEFIPLNSTNRLDSAEPGQYEVRLNISQLCGEPPLLISRTISIADDIVFQFENIEIQHTSCGAANGAIEVQVENGTPPYTYSFDNGQSFGTDNSIEDLAGGFYQAIIRDATGCELSDLMVIRGSIVPVIKSIEITQGNCDNPVSSFTVHMENLGQDYSFSIDGVKYQTNPVFSDLPPNTYHLWIKDPTGCIIEQDIDLSAAGLPQAEIIEIRPASCGAANGALELAIKSEYFPVRVILEGYPQQTTGSFNNLSPGKYQLELIDALGCKHSMDVEIPEIQAPVLEQVRLEATSCGQLNGRVEIIATGLELKYAMDNNSFQESPVFEKLPAGIYTLKIQDKNGCLLSEQIDIAPSSGIIINALNQELPGCDLANGSISIDAASKNGLLDYRLDGKSNPGSEWNNLSEGEYLLIIEDQSGCTFQKVVSIIADCPIYVPNVFSPNSDGYNDDFRIFGNTERTFWVKNYQIFNRWGALMFESSNFSIDDNAGNWWTGNYKGEPVNSGIYVYSIIIEHQDGKIEHLKGDIAVQR